MSHLIASCITHRLALLVAVGLLALTGCGGPNLPSFSAIKQELDVLPTKDQTPILRILPNKYMLELSKAAIDEKKESKDKTITVYKWWNSVKLDGDAVAPEHRGRVGHLVLTRTATHGKDAMLDFQFSYEIPKD